jgi:hypothetical protein
MVSLNCLATNIKLVVAVVVATVKLFATILAKTYKNS